MRQAAHAPWFDTRREGVWGEALVFYAQSNRLLGCLGTSKLLYVLHPLTSVFISEHFVCAFSTTLILSICYFLLRRLLLYSNDI